MVCFCAGVSRPLACAVTCSELVTGLGCEARGAQCFTVAVAFLLPEAEARFRGLLVALAARGARVLTIVFQRRQLRLPVRCAPGPAQRVRSRLTGGLSGRCAHHAACLSKALRRRHCLL